MNSHLIKLLRMEAEPDLQVASGTQDSQPQTYCPDCNWAITSDFSWCPKCGARTKPLQCQYCRGWVSIDETACPWCGAPAS